MTPSSACAGTMSDTDGGAGGGGGPGGRRGGGGSQRGRPPAHERQRQRVARLRPCEQRGGEREERAPHVVIVGAIRCGSMPHGGAAGRSGLLVVLLARTVRSDAAVPS